MGRKTDVLLRGFRAAKCLTLLKLATSRIKVLRNKRSISAKQMRGEIAQLLKSGQDAQVYITKADALIKQENMVAVYDLIDQYCHAIISRFPTIEMQSNCPIDMKGPIATLIFAAPRCVELSELASIKEAFVAKYGKEFAAAATELRPDCGVNKEVIELLSTRPATGDMKLKLMKEICVENNVNWTPGEALAGPSTNMSAGSSQQPVKANMEAIKVTGDVGSTKATLVEAASLRVSEAGPSNLSVGTKTTLQGDSKHEGINKTGIAAVQPSKHGVLATSASKSSGTKHGLSSEEDVGKANASVLQTLKGSTNTGNPSAKFGLAAAGSLKTVDGAVFATNAFKTNDTKEGMGKASFSAIQSLKGEINTGTSSAISGSFKESKEEPGKKAEAYVQTVDAQDGMSDSDNDSFVSVEEGRLEDDAEVSLMGGSARRESFGKNSLQAFVKADANVPSLIKKPSREMRESGSSTVSRPEDAYSRESSKKSSFTTESSQEDMFLRVSRKNSLDTEALPEEKSFRAESRKSSLSTDTLIEEKAFIADSRKSSLKEKKLAEEQSFKQVRENSLMKKQLEEEQSFEASVEEGVQRKDVLEDASLGVATESSVTQTLVEAYPFEEQRNKMTTEELCDNGSQRKGIIEGTSESSVEENLVEIKKVVSFSDRISAEEVSFGTGEEVSGKGASLNIKKSPESVSKQIDDVPSVEKGVQEVVGTSSLGPDYSQDFDFAAAAKAIAAEAARLAVLDYAKRIAGSSSLPVDLSDLTNFGLDFEGNPKGSQETKKLSSEGKSELVNSQEVRYGGDSTNDVIKEEASKVEIAVYDDKGINSDHSKIDEMGCIGGANMEKSMHSKTPVADDGGNGNNGNSSSLGHAWTSTKDESSQQPDMASGNDDINPFATKIDKATNSLFSKPGEDSWVTKTKPELVSKAGGFGEEGDHLDIFFKRKAPRFDEDRYSFVDVKSSFFEEKVPYLGYDKKESILKDKFVSTTVFDSLPGSQSILFEESSGSFKKESVSQDKFVSTPVFDSLPESQSTLFEETSGSFKIPVFDDEGPETYDASFSFDDGLDKSTLSVGLSDKNRPQSPPNIKASPRFDLEPEPSFDKVIDEEQQSRIEKSGQLKWQSKKPTKASEQNTSGEALSSDASLGGASNPMSRRSRRQPQRIDEHDYGSEVPAEGKLYTDGGLTSKRPQGSSSTLMQQQQKEQGRKDKYDVTEKGYLRTKPAESFAFSSDVMSKRPSSSPQRVSNQDEYKLSQESKSDRWDVTSTSVEDRFPSSRMTKSPIRSSQRQKATLEERDEDFYFAEEIGSTSSRSSMSRRSTKSPTKVAKQQPLPQVYDDDDDAEGYKFSNKPSRIPKFSQQDLDEDDSVEEEHVARYKPFRQSDDMGKGTSASSVMYRQKPHWQQEDYKSESVHRQYVQVNGVGKSNPTSRVSARRKQQDVEEEEDLASGYQPSVQVDDLGKSSSSRPVSSRKKIEEEDSHLAPRYKPSAQVDDLGRASSSPMSGRGQRQQRPQEAEQEVLPDWRQGERRKEKERMPRPSYGRKQDSRLEKEDSDSSIEDYEQQLEEQWRPSMSSEQEKHHRRLPPYEQEKQRRPLPPLQKYEQEGEKEEFHSTPLPDWRQEERRKEKERMPSPHYGRKQDSRLEKENSDLSIEDYKQQQEQQRRPSMLSEQEQDGQGKQRRRLPPYGQEKQRRPLPPLQQYEQEEEGEDFHSMPLPDWRQEERRKEKEHMPRPLYGWKQDARLERENLDLSIEDYEQQQEEQRRPSMLSEKEQGGQEKQRRRMPPYELEKQRRPLPPLQQYEQDEEGEEFHSMPLPDWRQEERRKEKERMPRPLYGRKQDSRLEKENSNLSIEDYEQQQKEQRHPSMLSEQEQDKQRRPSPPYGIRPDLKLEKDNSETWQQEKIRQEQRRPSSDRQQQQSLVEEVAEKRQQGREKEHLPSPMYTRQQEMQEEKKSSELFMEHKLQKEEQLHQSTSLPEGNQEQDGQGNENRLRPSYSRKQESKLEEEKSESLRQKEVVHYQLQDELNFGGKKKSLAKEEVVKGQQEKSQIKEQLPARQSLAKDEGVKKQEKSEIKEQLPARQSLAKDEGVKPEIKADPPARRPPSLPAQSTSPPLESSVSDPILLATIPPPVKKPMVRPVPAATTIESAVSAPPPSSVPEVKVHKAPNVEDLLANFEALRRARKGE